MCYPVYTYLCINPLDNCDSYIHRVIPEETNHHGNHSEHQPVTMRVDPYGTPMTDPLPRANNVGGYTNGGIPTEVTSPKRKTPSPPVAQQQHFPDVVATSIVTNDIPVRDVRGNSPPQQVPPDVMVTGVNNVQNGGSVTLPQPDPSIRENVLIKRKRFVCAYNVHTYMPVSMSVYVHSTPRKGSFVHAMYVRTMSVSTYVCVSTYTLLSVPMYLRICSTYVQYT